jgi:hypothetical protein
MSKCIKCILVVFFFLNLGKSNAIHLYGDALPFAGQTLVLQSWEEGITQHRITWGKTAIDEYGHFDLHCNSSKGYVYIISIGSFEGELYAEPDGEYRIEIPLDKSPSIQRFDKSNLLFEIREATDSLHLQAIHYYLNLEKFMENHLYDYALQKYNVNSAVRQRVYDRQKKEGVDLLPDLENANDSLEKGARFNDLVLHYNDSVKRTLSPHPFIQNLHYYSTVELRLLAGEPKYQLMQEAFLQRPLNLLHPAYIKTAELMFTPIFEEGPKRFIDRTNNAISLSRLDSINRVFMEYGVLPSVPTRMMALTLSLRDMAYSGRLSWDKHDELLRQCLRALQDDTTDCVELKLAIQNEIQLHHLCKKDAYAVPFEGLLISNKKWSTEKVQGKLTYLLFFTTWSAAAKKEVMALENIALKLGTEAHFVAVCLDPSMDTFVEFMENTHKPKAVWVYAGNAADLREKYQIKSVPTGVLLDPNGVYINDYTKLPSENVAIQMERWLASHKENNGKGTWKDMNH